MRVGNRHCERIGRILARQLCAGEQDAEHRLDLRLFRAAGADNRLFDEAGGIFADGQSGPRRRQQADTACLPQFER